MSKIKVGKNHKAQSVTESKKVFQGAGTREDMLKKRTEMLPEFIKEIEHNLEDYEGGMLAIINIREDGDGDTGAHTSIVGVSGVEEMLALCLQLRKAEKDLWASIKEGLPEDKLKDILNDLMDRAE